MQEHRVARLHGIYSLNEKINKKHRHQILFTGKVNLGEPARKYRKIILANSRYVCVVVSNTEDILLLVILISLMIFFSPNFYLLLNLPQ